MSLYHLNVTAHVVAAFVWLGGMFFLALVGAPVLRGVESPELRARLFRDVGLRFRSVGWGAIAVLLLTGVLNLHFLGILDPSVLGRSAFWTSPYGHTLAAKLGIVLVMLLLQAVHDFVDGPIASRLEPGSAEAIARRRRAAWVARGNAILGLALIVFAVRLARGG